MSMYLLDTSGLTCPEPIILTKLEINKMHSGAKLFITTDLSFQIDYEVFIKQNMYKLLQSWQEGSQYFFILEIP